MILLNIYYIAVFDVICHSSCEENKPNEEAIFFNPTYYNVLQIYFIAFISSINSIFSEFKILLILTFIYFQHLIDEIRFFKKFRDSILSFLCMNIELKTQTPIPDT